MEELKIEQHNAQQERQARGCFRLLILAVALASACIIFLALRSPIFGGFTTRLAENPYSPQDFATLNGYVTCLAGPTRLGIDVSEHQGTIDWEAVRDSGVEFAFIRIGYRGYSVGNIYPDDRARENLAGAKAAGLQVGVYFYAQAISVEEAAEEAAWCLDFLSGEALDLPLVYDWEYVSPSARTGGMDRQTLTQCAQTFCEAVEAAGYQPMLYFNTHVSQDLLDLKSLQQYPFWLAQYRDQMDYPYQVDFWQYTETGTIPGIKGSVDIDLMFIYE